MSNGNDNQAGNKNQLQFLSAGTWNALADAHNAYVQNHASLTADTAEGYRTACCSILDARLEALATEHKTNDPEYKECAFLHNALRKGWLVTDLTMLSKAFELVYRLPEGSARGRGMDLMTNLASKPADTYRLRSEYLNSVLEFFLDLKERDKNRLTGITSDTYDAMTAALARGSRLGPKTSVTDLIETLGEITKATDKYVELHEGIFHGPFSDDGKFRQNVAKVFSKFSKDLGQHAENLSAYLPDRTMPISENVRRREEGIASLDRRIAARQGLNPQNEVHVPQPVADGQAGLVM